MNTYPVDSLDKIEKVIEAIGLANLVVIEDPGNYLMVCDDFTKDNYYITYNDSRQFKEWTVCQYENRLDIYDSMKAYDKEEQDLLSFEKMIRFIMDHVVEARLDKHGY